MTLDRALSRSWREAVGRRLVGATAENNIEMKKGFEMKYDKIQTYISIVLSNIPVSMIAFLVLLLYHYHCFLYPRLLLIGRATSGVAWLDAPAFVQHRPVQFR